MTSLILGALAYIIPTFIFAFLWHLVVFKEQYEKWGYADVPNIPLGFASMIIQGVSFSWLYSMAPIDQTSFFSALPYVMLMGSILWSTHVVAAMAKNSKERNWGYFSFETLYLVLQFSIFAFLISSVVY